MKIFILAEVFFPDKIGGAGKYAYHLAKCLANKGNDVSVATRKSGNLVFEETIEGIKVFRVNWPDGPNPLKPILFLKEMHRLFYNLSLNNKFDLLIFN